MPYPQVTLGVLSCELGEGEGDEQVVDYELTDGMGLQNMTRAGVINEANSLFDDAAVLLKEVLKKLIWSWLVQQDPTVSNPSALLTGKLFVLNLSEPNEHVLQVSTIE